MKITQFETFLTNAGLRNYLFIRLRTDTSLTGVGEASLEWQEKTVETLAHEWVEGRVLGRDPFDIEAVIGTMIRLRTCDLFDAIQPNLVGLILRNTSRQNHIDNALSAPCPIAF